MNPKLVVCDIDNTLVARHNNMSSNTKQAIKFLNEKSIVFGIASGRPYCQVEPLIKKWNIDVDFIISANGCELIDFKSNQINNYYFMKAEWIKEIIELMKPFNANAMMVIDGIQTVEFMDDEVLSSSKYIGTIPRIVDDISEFYIDCPKIMFRVNPKIMDECEAYVKSLDNKEYKGFKTQPYLIEFTNKMVSKAFALNEFCKRVSIDKNDCWAFGDTSNDNDMLVYSGKGICMLNGSDDTKAIADEITYKTCDEDGFADYVFRKIGEE